MAALTEEDYSIGPSGLLAGIYNAPPDLRGSIAGEMRAQDILEKAGSVMARPQKPEWRQQSPLLDTALTMIDKALSFDPWHQILNIDPKTQIDPIAAMGNVGGAENAIFGPIRTAGQKQAVRALWRHNPGDVMAIEADPRTLTVTAPKGNVLAKAQQAEQTGWMPEGSAAVYDPRGRELRVAPATMLGSHYKAPLDEQLSDLTKSLGLELPESWTKPRIVSKSESGGYIQGLEKGGTTHLPESMGHEARHFLNRPKLYEQTDQEVADIFQKLAPYVSQHGRQAALEGAERNKNMGVALDEMLAYLSGKGTREPATEDVGRIVDQLLRTRPAEGGNMGARITPQSVDIAVEFAKRMNHPNPAVREAATAQWDRLASEGKLGLREGEYRAQTGFNKAFPDNPLFSMRQRTEPASMYERLPRAGRTFVSAGDLSRQAAGEQLPALGSAMPDIPRPVSSPGALEHFEALRQRLGLPPADLGGAAPEFYGKKTPPSSLLEARIRHGTDPEAAVRIFKEGLNPGSSISRRGGLDYEGYPVTLEFEDALRGAKDYSSPFGPSMHEGAAKIGEPAKDLKRVFFDPNEYVYKEDALDMFRKLREGLNETGRKGTKIERQAYDDVLEKYVYGGTPSLKGMKTFQQRASEATDKGLQRMLDEALDARHDARIDAAIEEMAKRNPEGLLKSKRGSAALNEIWKDWSTAGYGGTPNQVPQDRFMDTVLEALARATQSRSSNAQKHMFPYPAGVSGFRRSITPEEKMFGGGKHSPYPHDAQKSLDILEHLREYGFLEPGVLEEALKSTRGQEHKVLGQGTPVDPAGLERIKRLLERLGR
jgi:hypothetical protein